MKLQEKMDLIQKSVPDHEVRICRSIEIGTVLMQGDIYLHRVDDSHPRGDIRGTRKLSIGQGEGSNHMAEGSQLEVYEGVKLPDWVDFNDEILNQQALGPVVVAKESWLNTHTKHAHHQCPAGTYQVTYQIDMATRNRVLD